jgi:membrane-bound ClpP family serine protease
MADIIATVASLGPWAWIIAGAILLALELVMPGAFMMWFGIAATLVGAVRLVCRRLVMAVAVRGLCGIRASVSAAVAALCPACCAGEPGADAQPAHRGAGRTHFHT